MWFCRILGLVNVFYVSFVPSGIVTSSRGKEEDGRGVKLNFDPI